MLPRQLNILHPANLRGRAGVFQYFWLFNFKQEGVKYNYKGVKNNGM